MSLRLFRWLILFGTMSLCYYTPVTDSGTVTSNALRYRPDFLLFPVAALILAIWWIHRKQIGGTIARPVVASFYMYGAFIVLCGLSTVLAMVFLDIPLTRLAEVSAYMLIGCYVLALGTWVEASRSERWRIRIAWALALTPLLPIVITGLWFVNIDAADFIVHTLLKVPEDQPFVAIAGRYYGLSANPAVTTDICIVAAAFVWIALIIAFREGRWKRATALILYLAAMLLITLWTEVRSSYVALIVVFLFGSFLMGRSKGRLIRMSLTMGLIVVLALAGYASMPSSAKLGLALQMANDDRTPQWKYYLSVLPSVPLGAGLGYEERYTPPFVLYSDIRMPPHEEFLVAWMNAGMPGACLTAGFFLIIVVWGYRRVQSAGPPDAHQMINVAALVAFVGLWTSHLFLDMPFGIPIHSILLGILLSGSGSRLSAKRFMPV